MESLSNRCLRLSGFIIVLPLLLLAACGDDDGGVSPPTTGNLEVSTATTGSDVDANGYTVSVDGGAGQAIGATATVTLSGLSAGNHVVQLSDIAANCTVAGDNPRTVPVTAGATAATTFAVDCEALTASLEVTTVTTGDAQDDSYTVSVDGAVGQVIAASGSLTFSDLEPGDHTVELGDVALNCPVGGDNPRTVSLTAGAAGSTQFDIACTALVGDLTVSNTTSGNGLPIGYDVSLDGAAAVSLPVNDQIVFSGLAVADHTVELLIDPGGNCVVNGDNPVTVGVVEGGSSTAFDISCTAGSLDNFTVTNGLGIDADGYQVAVDDGTPLPIGVNGLVTFADLAVGDRSVELTGLDSNCTVQGENPRLVTIADGTTVTTTFDVFCWQNLGNQIVFQSNRDGDDNIYVATSNGSGQTRLTSSAATDAEPAVAPTGATVVFHSDRDGVNRLYLMDVLGIRRMTVAGAQEKSPSWSGDAVSVAYSRRSSGNVGWDIAVSFVDGTNTTNLTNAAGSNDEQPAFSTDGTKILFRSDRDGNNEIYVIDSDGTGLTRLTNDTGDDGKPAWSPDGTQILWVTNRDGNAEVYVADFDSGTNAISSLVNLTNNAGNDFMPDWKSDGSKIAFASDRTGNFELYTMNPDGTAQSNISNAGTASDVEPSWSP